MQEKRKENNNNNNIILGNSARDIKYSRPGAGQFVSSNLLKGYSLQAEKSYDSEEHGRMHFQWKGSGGLRSSEHQRSESRYNQNHQNTPQPQKHEKDLARIETIELKRKKTNHSLGSINGFPQPQRQNNKHQSSARQSKRHRDDSPQSKKYGRLRLLSRQQGNRESTPEQENIRDIESDRDSGEDAVTAAVGTAVARENVLLAELQSTQKILEKNEFQKFYDGSSDDDANDIHSSIVEDPTLPEGVVDFYDYGGMYPTPVDRSMRNKRNNSKKSQLEKDSAIRPGILTHVGTRNSDSECMKLEDGEGIDDDHDDGNVVSTQKSFESLGVSSVFAAHLNKMGFKHPTQVQGSSIPLLLKSNRNDALIKAATGSGKTLAYLVPILQDLSSLDPKVSRSDGTLALIMTPTRELSLQVTDVLTMLCRRFVWIVPGAVHGGEHRGKEKAKLRKGVSVLVATPGRLLDHLTNTSSFRTSKLRWLILDEADRLLDLGFEKKIREILQSLDVRDTRIEEERKLKLLQHREQYFDDNLEDFDEEYNADIDIEHNANNITNRKEAVGAESSNTVENRIKRCNVLLSATLHSNLSTLASLSLHDPIAVGFKISNFNGEFNIINEGIPEDAINQGPKKDNALAFEIPKSLVQKFMEVPSKLRLVAFACLLKDRLKKSSHSKIVAFLSTCDSVDFHHAIFSDGWKESTGEALLHDSSVLLKLHGDMAQSDRTKSLLTFTRADSGVLLCTDVAARGLDFPSVTSIVQFDAPSSAEEYVHRVGRTARFGASGEAIIFLCPEELGYLGYMKGLGITLKEEKVISLLNTYLRKDNKVTAGELPLDMHTGAFTLHKSLLNTVSSDPALLGRAEAGFTSFVRAYATHTSELKSIFSIKNLHLGHVAYSFALKDNPRKMKTLKASLSKKHNSKSHKDRNATRVSKFKTALTPKGSGGYVLS